MAVFDRAAFHECRFVGFFRDIAETVCHPEAGRETAGRAVEVKEVCGELLLFPERVAEIAYPRPMRHVIAPVCGGKAVIVGDPFLDSFRLAWRERGKLAHRVPSPTRVRQ